MITNNDCFYKKADIFKKKTDPILMADYRAESLTDFSIIIRTYRELKEKKTFKDRFQYLKLPGCLGEETFGWERYINQAFYKSLEWKRLRNEVIVRDMGLDLGCVGREIPNHIIVHHMNPIRPEDIVSQSEFLLNPDYLICCSIRTHNAIHYSDESILYDEPIIRTPGDTKLW